MPQNKTKHNHAEGKPTLAAIPMPNNPSSSSQKRQLLLWSKPIRDQFAARYRIPPTSLVEQLKSIWPPNPTLAHQLDDFLGPVTVMHYSQAHQTAENTLIEALQIALLIKNAGSTTPSPASKNQILQNLHDETKRQARQDDVTPYTPTWLLPALVWLRPELVPTDTVQALKQLYTTQNHDWTAKARLNLRERKLPDAEHIIHWETEEERIRQATTKILTDHQSEEDVKQAIYQLGQETMK